MQNTLAGICPISSKIGITGCKNNCLKAEENDLGLKGGILPAWESTSCTYCGVCEAVCPQKAITVSKQDKRLEFDPDRCTYCGKCVKSCPADSWNGINGYIVSFGGTFGNNLVFGEQLTPLVTDKEQLLKIVDTAIEFFREYGKAGERFRVTLDRVGKEKFRTKLKEAMQ